MINKAKALGLAFVAVMAFSAMAASAAQAGELDIYANPATLTAHMEPGQELVLTIAKKVEGTFNAKCSAATFEGTVVNQGEGIPQKAPETTVTATYGTGKGSQAEAQGCTLLGQKAQVLMNGCKYTITGAGQPAHTALVDIVGCTVGKQIQIIMPTCTVDVPEQNGLAHMVNKNVGGSETEVTSESTVTGITTTQTGAGCPDGNNVQSKNAAYAGNTIIEAFKDNGTTQVTKHGHQYSEHLCGEMVKLVST